MGLVGFLLGCQNQEESGETPAAAFLESGYILVSSDTNDNVVALSSDGLFVKTVYDRPNTAEVIRGLNYHPVNEEVLVGVDGADRVMAFHKESGEERIAVSHASLSGTIRGITWIPSDAYLVVESNVIERFVSDGNRVTSGGWPLSLQNNGQTLNTLNNGGFVLCSTGADIVATYDSDGVLVNSRASGVGTSTNSYGCVEMSNGNIAVTWEGGATDFVGVYSADLTTTIATYSDVSLLPAPRGIAQRANGNLLILDDTNHHIVEITSTGTYVDTIADSILNSPQQIIVIP